MDFVIQTDLALIRGQKITANFDEVSAWLDEELEPYKGMLVEADAIPTAKTYRANLRKVKDRIEQYRKEAKNAALMPYSEFETKCKGLTGKIDEAVSNLDSQIKAFEEKEKAEKVAELRSYYDTNIPAEIAEYCPWELVYNDKWQNKGYSNEDAKAEMDKAWVTTHNDIETIRAVGGDDTAYLLDFYKTHDLSATIRKGQEIVSLRNAEKERKEREERENAERLAREQERLRQSVNVAKPEPEAASETAEPEDNTPSIYTIDFRVWATKEQLTGLGTYMKSHGIRYGKIAD